MIRFVLSTREEAFVAPRRVVAVLSARTGAEVSRLVVAGFPEPLLVQGAPDAVALRISQALEGAP